MRVILRDIRRMTEAGERIPMAMARVRASLVPAAQAGRRIGRLPAEARTIGGDE